MERDTDEKYEVEFSKTEEHGGEVEDVGEEEMVEDENLLKKPGRGGEERECAITDGSHTVFTHYKDTFLPSKEMVTCHYLYICYIS